MYGIFRTTGRTERIADYLAYWVFSSQFIHTRSLTYRKKCVYIDFCLSATGSNESGLQQAVWQTVSIVSKDYGL